MKTKIFIVQVLFTLFLLAFNSDAAIIFEKTDWIIGTDGLTYEFIADEGPTTYQAELSDLSVSPHFGFDFLFLSISTSTETLCSIDAPGILYFDVDLGTKYFANVFGIGSGNLGAGNLGINAGNFSINAGNFGIKIQAVPIPGALLLMASGLAGLIGIRSRFR